MTKPYEHLSQVYDSGWSDFSVQYVDWINKLLAERGIAQGRILDLACGTGILAIELALCGHTVYGIDISGEMIKKAREKASGLSNISFDIQNMDRFSVDGKFNLVACTFDSINYLRRLSQLRRMLFRVASVLDDNGIFIFDSNTEILYKSHSNETTRLELNNQQFIQHSRYDAIQNEAITAFSFSDGTYEIHRQRPYNYDELIPILSMAGLRVLNLYSWFETIPYSSKTAKLFCVAEKS